MPEHEPRFDMQSALLSDEQSYGAENYQSESTPVPYERTPQWLNFFAGIASEVVRSLAPRRVFDAGCAWGFLVEALRDCGVEAWGIDSSRDAISKVRLDMRLYCGVGSLTEPISGTYDLITCVEAVGHMAEDHGREAVRQMCRATDTILFSSTPNLLDESGHLGVQPAIYWLRLFAALGFEPDLLYDASFVTPHAFLLRRRTGPIRDAVLLLFAGTLRERIDNAAVSARRQELEAFYGQTNSDLRREIADSRHRIARLEVSIQEMRAALVAEITSIQEQRGAIEAELGVLQAELDTERNSPAAKLVWRYREWMAYHRHRHSWLVRALETPMLWALRVARVAPLPEPSTPQVSTPPPAVPEAPPAERMYLTIDAPGPSTAVYRGAILRVSGWAVAQSGIDRVLIWLEDDGPYEALYGFIREDIQARFADFSDSSHTGFILCSSTAWLTPGIHSIRVQALSKAGGTAEATATFALDGQSQYEVWASLNTLTSEELAGMRGESSEWRYQPKISIVTPVYRPPEEYLRRCIDSVRLQAYTNWELIVVDDASGDGGLASLLESYTADPRIRLQTLPVNAGIAGATNAGLSMSVGEYVALLDHDDEISPDALYHIVRALNDDPSLDLLYSDEDKIDLQGRHTDGIFKPDWSPDLLGSMNYVCHFLVCRRELLAAVGGLRLGFDGSQDFDLVLRISERTDKIHRVPKVLYHWRMHPQSAALRPDAKPASNDAGRRALNDHLRRIGLSGQAEELGMNRYRIRYTIAEQPEVGIIIPTGGNIKLRTALETLLKDSTYQNYRVVVVDNSSGDEVREWVKDFQSSSHSVDWLDCRNLPFNFSLLCNRGAASTASPYLLFLNDDTSVITPDWLETMVEHAQRPQVGAVGCMLLFPNGAIQHAGVVLGMIGVAGHPFRALDERKGPYYFALSHVTRNYAAVTGACLLTRRQVFEKVGGFDEVNLPSCFQDVDLCLKMIEEGYQNVYTPHARLHHHESATKTAIAAPPEIAYMHSRWRRFIENDPFYNPNLSRSSDSYEEDITRRDTPRIVPARRLTRNGVESVVTPIRNPFVSIASRKMQSISSAPETIDYAIPNERHTEALLRQHPLDVAMSLAVGGQFESFGVLLRQVLLDAGLLPQHYLIDVGCGSGRLAHKLDVAQYLGTDVVPALVEYARSICPRPGWRFEVLQGIGIPERDEQADMVCFFSVLTHLLHEDTYRYLKEAVRVLKPAGRIVFSFHEWRVGCNWSIFEGMIRSREQGEPKHHDQYIEREAIETWSRHLGVEIESIWQGDIPHIRVPHPITLDDGRCISDITSLGQSVCVLRK